MVCGHYQVVTGWGRTRHTGHQILPSGWSGGEGVETHSRPREPIDDELFAMCSVWGEEHDVVCKCCMSLMSRSWGQRGTVLRILEWTSSLILQNHSEDRLYYWLCLFCRLLLSLIADQSPSLFTLHATGTLHVHVSLGMLLIVVASEDVIIKRREKTGRPDFGTDASEQLLPMASGNPPRASGANSSGQHLDSSMPPFYPIG